MGRCYENPNAPSLKKRMERVFQKCRISSKDKTHQRFEEQKKMEERVWNSIHHRHKNIGNIQI
ncbi:hypothetical protein AAA799D11_00633 [Marine Group I thaumarchaeote SCGC AAA799-D11]|uniref:Uncharacterized protein n=1 Tax=Marine Group I thaumarchaeote SCGC AAA799-D11 TaxID=1502291 RepID=A0A087RSQ5_9ARCH|nr:hypothetical protein AAA799D11_00633 [Marine Group I thaumarchaeote SCGC AAA799-D11]